jgi:quercetin dioxygenase-like cupin family protein
MPSPEPEKTMESTTLNMTDPEGLRQRLLDRVARSAAAARALVTVRGARAASAQPAPGVLVREFYRASGVRLRRGEPHQVQRIELRPDTRWAPEVGDPALQSEWLVLQGDLDADGVQLGVRDYLVVPAGEHVAALSSVHGAVLYRRLAAIDRLPGETTHAVHDAVAGWDDYVPGIQRRVLWQRGGQAAMLYLAAPGAAVPRHAHGHDEECLMVEGDVFLDEVMLRPGDWQLAPVGTQHGGVSTDTGGVLFAHGDLDLDVIAG